MALVQPTSNDDALLDQLIDAGVLATDQSAPPVTEPTQPGSIATPTPAAKEIYEVQQLHLNHLAGHMYLLLKPNQLQYNHIKMKILFLFPSVQVMKI